MVPLGISILSHHLSTGVAASYHLRLRREAAGVSGASAAVDARGEVHGTSMAAPLDTTAAVLRLLDSWSPPMSSDDSMTLAATAAAAAPAQSVPLRRRTREGPAEGSNEMCMELSSEDPVVDRVASSRVEGAVENAPTLWRVGDYCEARFGAQTISSAQQLWQTLWFACCLECSSTYACLSSPEIHPAQCPPSGPTESHRDAECRFGLERPFS